MIRILLTEDEPHILNNLAQLISPLSDCEIWGTAENGEAALALLAERTDRPDVLLTDIRMPGMDGLGLIRRVRHLYPSVECAILSGYGEFEYAQTAMSLGVSQYLLKPVKQAELFMLMDELNRKATQHHLEKSVATAGSAPTSSQTQESKDQVNIAMVVCCGNFPIHAVHNPDRVDFWERINLTELLSSVAPQAQHWIMAGKTPVERNIALSLRDCSPEQGLDCARRIYGTLCHIGGPITVGVKVDFGSLYSLGRQVLKLRNLLAERAIPGLSQIIDVDIPVPNGINLDFSLWRENLSVLFYQKKIALFRTALEKTIKEMADMCVSETHIWRFFNQLFAECHNQVQICYTPQAEADLAEAIVISEHYKDLAANIHPLFAELMGTSLSVQQQPESRETLLLAADNYIQHHFCEPINTQTLAAYFSISPAYFGKIFREYKSVSPIEYITALRIEHAKKLFLTDKHVSVKSVAELVGYDDPFYFSKVFKRMTGKSPKDFLEDGGRE